MVNIAHFQIAQRIGPILALPANAFAIKLQNLRAGVGESGTRYCARNSAAIRSVQPTHQRVVPRTIHLDANIDIKCIKQAIAIAVHTIIRISAEVGNCWCYEACHSVGCSCIRVIRKVDNITVITYAEFDMRQGVGPIFPL